MNRGTRQEHIKVAMLVDVRQLANDPQDVMDSRPTVVGLHTLDECVSIFGDPRKLVLEKLKWDRNGVLDGRLPTTRDSQKDGELAISLPALGQFQSLGVGIDELERKMIESRPELIDDFPCDDLNVSRSINKEMKCFFTVRICEDFARVFGFSQIADNTINLIEVSRYPAEFEFGRRHAANG